MINTDNALETLYLDYLQGLAKALKPIKECYQMTADEMLSKWNTGDVRKYTMVIETPDWNGYLINEGNPMKRCTGAISIVDAVEMNDLDGINKIHADVDELFLQLIAKIKLETDKGQTFMRTFGDTINIETTVPYNKKTCQGKRMQFDFYTPAKLLIDTKLWD